MTPLEKYLAELNRQKQLAESRFNNLSSFQNQLLNSSYEWLLNNLNLQNGVFEVPGDLPGLMNGFVDNILKIAEKSANYEGAVQNLISDLGQIRKNIDEFHNDFHSISVKKPGLKDVQKAVIDQIIDQYSENGLNIHFAQPLRELMFNNILAGMSQTDARKYLKDYIQGGKDQSGKLDRYLIQTAQQGVDSYTGAINMKLKKDFDFTGYIISGSLIDTSSKQCIYAVETSEGGYLSFEDWKKVLEMAKTNKKAPLIDGTTIDNLPLNKLHWGCRHEFTPTIRKQDIKQPPKKVEAPKPAPKPKEQPGKEFKNPKEVAEYLKEKGIVKNADISIVQTPTAAKTAAVFENIYKAFDLKPIDLKSTNRGNFRARANGSHIEIQAKQIEEKVKSNQSYQDGRQSRIRMVQEQIEGIKQRLLNKPDDSVRKHYEKQLKTFEKSLEDLKGFTRWTVDNTVEGTIIHEFGHVIHDQTTGGINSFRYLRKKADFGNGMFREYVDLNEEIKDLYFKLKKSPEKYKLSEYGMYNDHEMFAEGFVLYFTGRKNELPEGLEKLFDKYLKLIKK